VFFHADTASRHRRTASVGPGLTTQEISDHWPDDSTTSVYDGDDAYTLRSNSSIGVQRGRRTLSVDSTTVQRNFLSHQEQTFTPPTPPYPSPSPSTVPSTSELGRSLSSSDSPRSVEDTDQSPAQSLLDFRTALNAGIVTRSSSRHSLLSLAPDDSARTVMTTPASNGVPTIGNVPEDQSIDAYRPLRNPSSPPAYRISRESLGRSGYPSPPPSPVRPRSSSRTPPSSSADRGRSRNTSTSRLRFSSIIDTFRDPSPRSPQRQGRDSSEGRSVDGERGRTTVRRVVEEDNDAEPELEQQEKQHSIPRGRHKSVLGRFTGLLGFDGEENKESGDGWKEFKPGSSVLFKGLCIDDLTL
jgi:arrestin-related trafficking adapter 3/6